MLAVLEDALYVFQRGLTTSSCKQLQAFRDVDRWFRSRDADSPFSFESICCTLLIAADRIRDGLNKLQRDALQSRARTYAPYSLRDYAPSTPALPAPNRPRRRMHLS